MATRSRPASWLRVVVVLFCTVFMDASAYATTLRVPSEYPSIEAANMFACAGDTILVAPGEYVEGLFFLVPGVRLLSEQGADATRLTVDALRVDTLDPTPVTTVIDGFYITNPGTPVQIDGTNNVIVSNNRLVSEGRAFVSASPIMLIGNWIESTGGETAVVFSYTTPTASVPGPLVIADNVIVGSKNCILVADLIQCQGLFTDVVFDHNTVFGAVPGLECIIDWVPCLTATMSNNIFHSVNFNCLDPIVFTYNTLSSLGFEPCVDSADETNIFDDPLFCEPNAGPGMYDLRLQPGSPAIGMAEDGTNMGAPLPPGCDPLAVEPEAPPRPFRLTVTPNPSPGPMVIRVSGAAWTPSGRVFDLAGRLVASLAPTSPSTEVLLWDGTTTSGESAAPGAYVVVVEAGGTREQRVVVIVK